MIEVFHGTTCVIKQPSVERGRDNLDFGKAFYVTRIKSQAANWAQIVYGRYEENAPIINTYSLDIDAINYDYIEGGVANDRVIDTLEGYMNGDFSADVAIGRLKYHKPNNQIAILNQNIIGRHLKWIGAEIVEKA